MMREYDLKFGQLKPGIHEFSYDIGKSFFTESEDGLIQDGELSVLLKLERSESHLNLDFGVNGFVRCSCDICLSDLRYPVKSENTVHVKITDSSKAPDDPDVIFVPVNEYKINLYQHLYDFIHLALPMRRVCEDSLNRDGCDEVALNAIEGKESRTLEQHPEMEKLRDLFKKKE